MHDKQIPVNCSKQEIQKEGSVLVHPHTSFMLLLAKSYSVHLEHPMQFILEIVHIFVCLNCTALVQGAITTADIMTIIFPLILVGIVTCLHVETVCSSMDSWQICTGAIRKFLNS